MSRKYCTYSIRRLLGLYLTVSDWNGDYPSLNVVDGSLHLLYLLDVPLSMFDEPSVLQASFVDFLQEPARSAPLALDMKRARKVTWECCTRIVQEVSRSRMSLL